MKDAVITVDVALALRGLVEALGLKVPLGDLRFRCPECKRVVKPFADGLQGPHFEHLEGNKICSLSDA